MAEIGLGAVRQHEMRFDVRALFQDFQQPQAHLDAARARDADDDALYASSLHTYKFSSIICATLSYTFFAAVFMKSGAVATV